MSPSAGDSQHFNLAIFASGSGSNADKIASYFTSHPNISIAFILSNKETAGVEKVALEHKIPFKYLENSAFREGHDVLDLCQSYDVNCIILAGFLRKIPDILIQSYPDKIINIHPALLPKYGGKGMYGKYVHQAVKDANEIESGPTIHLVSEKYDEGRILFQAHVEITSDDTPEDIGKKVLKLEHQYYAPVIEGYLLYGEEG